MWKSVEIEVDVDLVDEVIRRFRVRDTREAVHLALRTLLNDGERAEEEFDEFSDLSAWQPRHDAAGGGSLQPERIVRRGP
jgi:Arc/MetJ family transcription regulator